MNSNTHYKNHNKNSSRDKFWSQKQNIYPEGMPQKMNYQKRFMKYMVDLLNEETHKDRKKKKLFSIYKSENGKTATSGIEEHLSDNVKKILKKIGKNVDHIKKSILDITKMNELYLEEKAKKTFFKKTLRNTVPLKDNKNQSALDLKVKNKEALKRLNFKKTQSEINIRGNLNKTFLKNKIDNSEFHEKKNDYTQNFVKVNDNYRRQLNFAFLKYNADQHLGNMKFLIQSDPSIREDVSNIIQEVQNDIDWKCDKKHFYKKYLNLKEKYDRIRRLKLLHEKEQAKLKAKEKEKENSKEKLPNINNNNNLKRTRTKSFKQKSFANIFNKLSYGLKYNKKELSKLKEQKEQSKEVMNHMLIASKEIDNFIQDDNINNKIDMFKTDYFKQIYGYYPINDNNESNNINLLDKDYFLEEKENIVKKIGNVFSFKMDKNVNEQEKLYKGKIYDEAKKFRKRIVDGKKSALDEFNGYITTYQVKLPNDKEKNENNDNNSDLMDFNKTSL